MTQARARRKIMHNTQRTPPEASRRYNGVPSEAFDGKIGLNFLHVLHLVVGFSSMSHRKPDESTNLDKESS